MRAFRCQLPRDNPLYPPVPAGPGDTWPRPPPAGWAAGLATTPDRWRVLEAEAAAAAGAEAPPPEPGTHLYPEMEVVVEDEDSSEDEEDAAMD